MSFIEKDYKEKSTSNWMKFIEGENIFRILGSFTDGTAIKGQEYWKTIDGERKPVRVGWDDQILLSELEENPKTGELDMPKYFWALPVYNVGEHRVQILEITQKSIRNAILSLANNPKWGDPINYEVVVTRTLENGKTGYSVTPNPKEKIDDEVLNRYKAIKINLSAMFSGNDPFAQSESEIDPSDIPDFKAEK